MQPAQHAGIMQALHLANGCDTYVGILRCPKNRACAGVIARPDAPVRGHRLDREVCPTTYDILWLSAIITH